MTKATRGRYTLEFKQEAARLLESARSRAAAARSLGVVEHSLGNWVGEHRAGTLKGVGGKSEVSAEQTENRRLRAELARVTMERDILEKATAFFAKGRRRSTPLLSATSWSGQSVCRAGCCRWASPATMNTLPDVRPTCAYCPASPPRRRGTSGSYRCCLCGESRRVWMAADLAAAAGPRQAAGTTAHAKARHSSSR